MGHEKEAHRALQALMPSELLSSHLSAHLGCQIFQSARVVSCRRKAQSRLSRGMGLARYIVANSPTRPQHHHLAARTVHDELDSLGPGFEGLTLFLQILVPIVGACQSSHGMT